MKDNGFAQELKRRLSEKDAQLKSLLNRINDLQEATNALRVLIKQETGEVMSEPAEITSDDTLHTTSELALETEVIPTQYPNQPTSPTKAGRAFVRSNPDMAFTAAILTEYLKKLDKKKLLKHSFKSLDNIGHTVIFNLGKTKDIVHVKKTENPKFYRAKK